MLIDHIGLVFPSSHIQCAFKQLSLKINTNLKAKVLVVPEVSDGGDWHFFCN